MSWQLFPALVTLILILSDPLIDMYRHLRSFYLYKMTRKVRHDKGMIDFFLKTFILSSIKYSLLFKYNTTLHTPFAHMNARSEHMQNALHVQFVNRKLTARARAGSHGTFVPYYPVTMLLS